MCSGCRAFGIYRHRHDNAVYTALLDGKMKRRISFCWEIRRFLYTLEIDLWLIFQNDILAAA